MKKVALLLIAIAAAGSASHATASETLLKGQSLHALFPGYFEAKVFGGYTLKIAARADGRLDGSAFGRQDKGHWSILEDRVCIAWRRWTSGEDKCGRIAQDGMWYIAYGADNAEMLRFRAIAPTAFNADVASASLFGRD